MSEAATATAVIRAEPDGYNMAKLQLMGRQAAGFGFLRAAIAARGEHPIHGFTPRAASARGFQQIVKAIDPSAGFNWIGADQLNRLGDVGVLYLADATVSTHARLRLRAGLTRFSLCGVTHTTASFIAMDEISGLLREAVAPWDALVCTSSAVIETVRRVHEAEADYLRWRFGPEARIQGPQLPLIPLGVHCDDFVFDDGARAKARDELGLEPDEVAGLFVGRLVFHAKAHPVAMFRGFQLAAERTGKRLALILSGWFPNAVIEAAFRSGAAQYAPDVRILVVDGREAAARDQAWAAADLFVSLSDNIQETFGLTPIEAMAAGLPVVVSDWDGYKDTVRHGVDGYRVRTYAPEAGMGQALAHAAETGKFTYDQYCWAAAQATAVDIAQVADAIAALAQDPDLRRRLGQAGRQRAREVYDWAVVYGQYQALWAELNARRQAAIQDAALQEWLQAAPRAASSGLDPFHAFGHYPTETLGPASRLTLAPGATRADLQTALAHPLFGALSAPTSQIEALFALIETGDATPAEAAAKTGANTPSTVRTAVLLMKMGLVEGS